MTLDVAKFITNAIRNQAKIHHLDIKVKAVPTKNVPQSVSSPILDEYGEQYLLDSSIVAFFWGNIDRNIIKDKLFNVVDKALGKSANKLTDKDFKKINIELNSPVITSDETSTEDIEDAEDDNDDNEIDNGIEDDEDFDDEASDETDEDADEDSDETLNEDETEVTSIKTSYFFLKITPK